MCSNSNPKFSLAVSTAVQGASSFQKEELLPAMKRSRTLFTWYDFYLEITCCVSLPKSVSDAQKVFTGMGSQNPVLHRSAAVLKIFGVKNVPLELFCVWILASTITDISTLVGFTSACGCLF